MVIISNEEVIEVQKLNKNVTMQQLLHGYKEGHRLLASSIKLPDSTEIELQRLTDLSGPSLIPGFETYVTGFPIIKNKYYTFSRTWYASEMKRPGCVWTHTLLIDFDDLYLIDALSFLNKLFQRPKSKKDFSAYNQSITITRKNETTKCILETYQENVLRGILQLFYEKPKKTIIIPIKDQTDIENIVNLIWIFQWPALKQSFSFCTGTLDPLKYIKNSFDLLFCPSDLRYIQFHDQKKVILYSDQDVINKPKPRWILNLIKEMQTVNTSKLKDFIIYNGIDLSEKRNNMQKLINIFYKLKNMKPNKQTEENLCDFIGNLFPKDTEAVQLKTSIFGPWEDMNNQSITYLDDKQALTQLINCEQQSAFNPKKLKIDKRSQQLWINNPNESKRMLRNVINLDPNPLGIAFIKGIAKAVQPNDLSRLLKDDPWIVNILVNHDPSLATQKMLWTTGPNVQEELFNAFIQGNSKKQNLIEPVIKAMLEAESDYVADEVESLLGSEIVPIVLNWLNSENAKSQFVEKRWIIILSNYIEEIIEWMKKTDKINLITTSTLVNILEPESFIIEQIPVKIWYKFVFILTLTDQML